MKFKWKISLSLLSQTMLLITLLVTYVLIRGDAVAKLDPKVQELFKTLPINEFIEYFNKQNYSYTIANYDHLGDRTMFGVILKNNTRRNAFPMEEIDENLFANLPKTFDSRIKWSNCSTIGEIYNQKQCGSCWAFGTATVASDRICIHTGVTVRLSVQDFECHKRCVCCGGTRDDAFEFWRDTGLVTQSCKPYDIDELRKEQCNKKCVDGKPYEDDKHFAEKVYQVKSDVNTIKAELVSRGPVEALIVLYEDLQLYKHGIYGHKFGNLLGLHSIRIIGYGVENGQDYWLVANSWGSEWGINGLVKIKIQDEDIKPELEIFTGLPKM